MLFVLRLWEILFVMTMVRGCELAWFGLAAFQGLMLSGGLYLWLC
jgi:hypothetical protein